jgi:antibiotic biosynthesis monooxygenase (ABM) superfamily enzyme
MKMALLTYIGLLPLVLTIPEVLAKLTGLEGALLLSIATAIIVLLMTFIVMPLLLKVFPNK